MWSVVGLVGALSVALVAFVRSRSKGGFYDAGIYGMSARSHRSYAVASLAFAVAFFATFYPLARDIAVWLFAAFVPFALFYVTSFLRGAHEDDDGY